MWDGEGEFGSLGRNNREVMRCGGSETGDGAQPSLSNSIPHVCTS